MLSGIARVIAGDRQLFMNTYESTYIPTGHKHLMDTPCWRNLNMTEVQSGGHLGEADIVRFENNHEYA